MTIEYCRTEVILANFFTKPLQGSLLQIFCQVIMGYEPISSLFELYSIKEHVGNIVIESGNPNDKNEESILKLNVTSRTCKEDRQIMY